MTIQHARHECHACGPLQAEKPGIQPVVGNTHGTHVEQVVSSFQKILRGSQLTWYIQVRLTKVRYLSLPLAASLAISRIRLTFPRQSLLLDQTLRQIKFALAWQRKM